MIAASAPKRLALRLIAALLVLVAATHAVLPTGPQAELRSGSAFSAATVDVAIGCDRQRIETRALPDRPAPPMPDCAPALVPLPAHELASALPLRSRARAPPLPAPALAPLNPRAPPAA